MGRDARCQAPKFANPVVPKATVDRAPTPAPVAIPGVAPAILVAS
jgi:hypothetical protein